MFENPHTSTVNAPANRTIEDCRTYERPHDLPPTAIITASAGNLVFFLFHNSLFQKHKFGVEPWGHSSGLRENLCHFNARSSNIGSSIRPSPSTQQSYQNPIPGFSLTPDSFRNQHHVLLYTNISFRVSTIYCSSIKTLWGALLLTWR